MEAADPQFQFLITDIMTACQSFSSDYHPYSQSRKISIGVVDKSDNTRPKKVREDVAAVPITGNLTSSNPIKGKQTEALVQETSPWVSTRTPNQNMIGFPSSEVVRIAKPASSLPLTRAVVKQRQKSKDTKDSQQMYTMQFTANQMSILRSDVGLQKKINSVTYRRKGGRDANSARMEEVSFATAQEVVVPDKEVTGDRTENTESKGNETLRTKLWEVLGAVTTPTKQCSNSQSLKTGTDNLEPEWKSDRKNSPVVKPRQNSDTTESDSDSRNHTMRRPVTHSLTRKRPPTKVQQRKTKNAPSSRYKSKYPETTIFSFEQGWSRRIAAAVNGVSSDFKRKKIERESSIIEPRKLYFPELNDADDTNQAADRSKTKTPAEKTSSFGNGMGRFYNFPYKESKDSHQSPVVEKTDKLGDLDEPTIQENVVQQEDMFNPSMKSILDPQFDFHSPTLEMKKPIETSSLSSSPKNNQGEQDVHSPIERVLNMEGIRTFKSFLTLKPDYYRKKEEMDTSDDEGEHEDSPVANSLPIMKENHTEDRPSKSSSEENDSESSDEGSTIEVLKYSMVCTMIQSRGASVALLNYGAASMLESSREAETPSPNIGIEQEPENSFHPSKRHCIYKRAEVTEFGPTSVSPKGTEDISELPSELNQENGLARAVALFAMILERVKSKMKSMTSKKSAEILTSVGMEIHLQLQNAQSQIQTDMGKLTGIGKSKRKHLETRFQEQHEQLKVIYAKFRDEVNQHLQDCRSTLEGLEAHQIQFKGTVERQKASHKKLLLQAEEAIETQLNDAQRRITDVHKSAREKMLQLKYVISECLEEDIRC